MISSYQRRRRVRELDAAVHRKMRLRRFRRSIVAAMSSPSAQVVGGIMQLGERAFPEMLGTPNSVLGRFEGEIVHTGGGTWIWRLFQWESYRYPG